MHITIININSMAVEYIKSRIKTDNHHDIFYKIYDNFNEYKLVNREYCKNYLLILFREVFNKDIDMDIISEMNGKNKTKRIGQCEFREHVLTRFDTCIISGLHAESCDVCHIYDLEHEKLNYDINNGILMNATLHREFDKLKWCINPTTYKIIISKKCCDQSLGIKKYINVDLKSKLQKYPQMTYYLEKKYNKFMDSN